MMLLKTIFFKKPLQSPYFNKVVNKMTNTVFSMIFCELASIYYLLIMPYYDSHGLQLNLGKKAQHLY